MEKKLYRSNDNKVLMGLCGGLAEYFNTDPALVRILAVIFEFATGGLLIIAYFIVALIVPKKPA